MSQLYNMAKLLTFICFVYPPLLYPKLPYTERQGNRRRPHHNLLRAGRSIALCAPQEHSQADKAPRPTLAPFPCCSIEAQPNPHSGQKEIGELFPPASTLHIHQCKKGLLQLPTVVHHESLWYPVPAVSAMVPVPKWLWDSPPGSARHHSPRVPFTYKYPSLFKVSQAHRQDTGLGFRTSELHA